MPGRIFDSRYERGIENIEQENKLLRQRNVELQQMLMAKCDCEYFGRCQDDPQKGDYCPLARLDSPEDFENKIKAER